MALVLKIAESAVSRVAGMIPMPQPEVFRTRYPVVLMHGFGLLAGLKRHGHLHDEAMHLRTHAVMAFAPNVPPYTPIEMRAAVWQERLDEIMRISGAEKLNLIAHSMGGLDARFLIAHGGWADRVASLTTLSTPHRGSYIASYVLEQPERLTALAAELVNWLGEAVLEGAESNVLAAVRQLTPAFMEQEFNPATPDHPAVTYSSWAGRAGKNTSNPLSPVLLLQNQILFDKEGPNDGLVSVRSAEWSGFKGYIEADHAEQIGLRVRVGGKKGYSSKAFFTERVKELAAAGF